MVKNNIKVLNYLRLKVTSTSASRGNSLAKPFKGQQQEVLRAVH